jgi:uncharacterized membrane protein
MDKFVVVAFPDEKQAYEGVRALKELNGEGSLTLYSTAVIQRNAKGGISVKQAQTDGPIGTGVGALVGGLVGLFAGPVGAAVGMGAGGALGALRDLYNLGVSNEFLDAITQELTAGKTAVVAEISEEWVTPLDSRMEAIGGVVARELRDDFIDEKIEKRIEKSKKELAQRKAELATAGAKKVEAMKKAVVKAEEVLRSAADNANARVKHYRQESEAKIHALQEQAKKAQADARSRIDQRIAEVRADQKQRLGKLEKAWELTKDALRP